MQINSAQQQKKKQRKKRKTITSFALFLRVGNAVRKTKVRNSRQQIEKKTETTTKEKERKIYYTCSSGGK